MRAGSCLSDPSRIIGTVGQFGLGDVVLHLEDVAYEAIDTVAVEPSDNLWGELGNNTYDFRDLISELIDNALAAKLEDELLEVSIQVVISEANPAKSYVIIRDNGSGIPLKKLGTALSPGAHSGGSTLNEHGLGMKQAIAALGKFKYLATRTPDSDTAVVVDVLKFGELPYKRVPVDWPHGTEICVENLKGIVPPKSQSYSKSIVEPLGARYRRFLRPDATVMSLQLTLCDADHLVSGAPRVVSEWQIREVKPVYFHPSERTNKPAVLRKSFSGAGWQAELTFGYAPSDVEYEELGLEVPSKYHPYFVSLNKQGFDLIKNDRIIKFAQLSELHIVATRHNKYNHVRGEIDLKSGFTTAITKNHVIHDERFDDLIRKVTEFLNSKDYLERRTYPDELPEKLLRDRLKKYLETNHFSPKKDVKTEYAVGGLGGFIDILADGEAYELKVNQASGLEVYQLFAYLDMGEIESGYLIAPSFGTGAEAAVAHIAEKHGKTIRLVPTKDFPITDPPSQKELEDYYGAPSRS